MDNIVLKFKSEHAVKPKKFRVSQSRNGPTLDITNSESLTIEKFLKFIKRDVLFQMSLIKKANLTSEDLNRNVFASSFLMEYVDLLLTELDRDQ